MKRVQLPKKICNIKEFLLKRQPLQPSTAHLAPARAEYVQAFAGVNFKAEKISGALFEISGALSKALATQKFSGPLFEV